MSRKTVRIRPLSEADAGVFSAFREEIALEGSPARKGLSLDDDLRSSFEAFRAGLPLPEPGTVMGAFVEGALVGAAVVVWPGVLSPSPGNANLWGMFVLPRVRGRGIGRLLVRQAVAHAFVHRGVRSVQLQLFGRNETALRLYRSLGFEAFEPDRDAVYFYGSYKEGIHMQLLNPKLPDGIPEVER